MGTLRPRRQDARRRQRDPDPRVRGRRDRRSPRRAGPSRAAWTTAPRSTAREGVAYADLLHGNAIETYSAAGYGYAVEKAGTTQGWSFTIYEEPWNYGFPQEMAHFVDCVRERQAAAGDRRGRPGGAGGDLRRLRLGGDGRRIDLPFATRRRGRSTCGSRKTMFQQPGHPALGWLTARQAYTRLNELFLPRICCAGPLVPTALAMSY